MRAPFIAALLCGAHAAHGHDPKCCVGVIPVKYSLGKTEIVTKWIGTNCITKYNDFEGWAEDKYTDAKDSYNAVTTGTYNAVNKFGNDIEEAIEEAGWGVKGWTKWAEESYAEYAGDQKEAGSANGPEEQAEGPVSSTGGTSWLDYIPYGRGLVNGKNQVDPETIAGQDGPGGADQLGPDADERDRLKDSKEEESVEVRHEQSPREDAGQAEGPVAKPTYAKWLDYIGHHGRRLGNYMVNGKGKGNNQVHPETIAGQDGPEGADRSGPDADERARGLLVYLEGRLEDSKEEESVELRHEQSPREDAMVPVVSGTAEEPGLFDGPLQWALLMLAKLGGAIQYTADSLQVVYDIYDALKTKGNQKGADHIKDLFTPLGVKFDGGGDEGHATMGGDYGGDGDEDEEIPRNASNVPDLRRQGVVSKPDLRRQGIVRQDSCACGKALGKEVTYAGKSRGPFADETVCQVLGKDYHWAGVGDQLALCLKEHPETKSVSATVGNVINIYEAMAMAAGGNKVTGPTTPEEAQEAARPFVSKECLDMRYEACGIEEPGEVATCRFFAKLREELSQCLGPYHREKETFDSKALRDGIVSIYMAMASEGKEIQNPALTPEELFEVQPFVQEPFVQEVCLGMRYDKCEIEKPGEVATCSSFAKLRKELSLCLGGYHRDEETFDSKARRDGIVSIYMKMASSIKIPGLKRHNIRKHEKAIRKREEAMDTAMATEGSGNKQVAKFVQEECLGMRKTRFKECAPSAAQGDEACKAFVLADGKCEEWLDELRTEEGSAIPEEQLEALGAACRKKKLTRMVALKVKGTLKQRRKLVALKVKGALKQRKLRLLVEEITKHGGQAGDGVACAQWKAWRAEQQPGQEPLKLAGPLKSVDEACGLIESKREVATRIRIDAGPTVIVDNPGKNNHVDGPGKNDQDQKMGTRSRAYKVARRLLNQLRQMMRSVGSKKSSGSATIGRA